MNGSSEGATMSFHCNTPHVPISVRMNLHNASKILTSARKIVFVDEDQVSHSGISGSASPFSKALQGRKVKFQPALPADIREILYLLRATTVNVGIADDALRSTVSTMLQKQMIGRANF